MALIPLEHCITPRSGDDLITRADDPSVFSLQLPGSAGELWCGVVVPSPPCSPFLKSIVSKTEAIAYDQEKCCSVDWRSGNIEGQAVKNGMLAKESPVLLSLSKARGSSGGLSIRNLTHTGNTLMSPFDRSSLSPPRRPNTTDVPVAHALSLPDIQPRPSSAPAWSSGDTPSSRPSTPTTSSHVTPKQKSDMDLSAATQRSNAVSMSGIMALGTRQTIASPNIMPTLHRPYMPPIGSAQISGGYPPLATGPAVPPSINYNMFGLVNIQTNSSAQRGGFPFFVPRPPVSVPQNLPGRVSQAANTYVPGFPAFFPAPMNAGWAASSPMVPYSNGVYPNFQHHANHMQESPSKKASNLPNGLPIRASESRQQNEDALPPRQFIIHDPTSFSTTETQARGKRRRTSVSTTSSSGSSEYNTSSSSIAYIASTAVTSESSFSEPLEPEQHGPTFICKLDGCSARLRSVDKRSFNHHLILGHNFHGSGKRDLIRCKWRDSPSEGEKEGAVCGKLLQMQSLVKHVCEKHFNSLGQSCSLCGSRQARADNMARHLVVCKAFAGVGSEVQRRIWQELVPAKSFDDVYLGGKGMKRRKVANVEDEDDSE